MPRVFSCAVDVGLLQVNNQQLMVSGRLPALDRARVFPLQSSEGDLVLQMRVTDHAVISLFG